MNNRFIFSLLVVGIILASCKDSSKKVATSDAKEVIQNSKNSFGTYKTVKDGHIKWKATHLGGVQPRFGKIFIKNAVCMVSGNALTNAGFDINMSTLTVENFPEGAEEIEKLKGHLISDDFFNIEKFPKSTFEMTSISKIDGKFNSKVTGNLTMFGITKSITFDANVNITSDNVSIESETFSIDRRDWGLTYHVEGSVGVPVDYIVSNSVEFTIKANIGK